MRGGWQAQHRLGERMQQTGRGWSPDWSKARHFGGYHDGLLFWARVPHSGSCGPASVIAATRMVAIADCTLTMPGMPARTNDFQAVVYFVKKHIAPDAVVKESAMLVDRVTGEKREVDVLITAVVAGQQLAIGIETRDHQRPQGVEWVEQVAQKHSRLPINQTVLVSRKGFTRSAKALAAKLGIELAIPGEPISEQGPLAGLGLQVEAREIAWLGEVRVWARVTTENGEPADFELSLENRLFASDGSALGNVAAFVREQHAALQPQLGPATALAAADAKFLKATTEPVLARHPRTSELTTVHLRRADVPEALLAVASLTVAFAVELRVIPMDLAWSGLQGVDYAVGNGDVVENRALVVITNSEQGPHTSIRLTDRDGKVVDLDENDIIRMELTQDQTQRVRASGQSRPESATPDR